MTFEENTSPLIFVFGLNEGEKHNKVERDLKAQNFFYFSFPKTQLHRFAAALDLQAAGL